MNIKDYKARENLLLDDLDADSIDLCDFEKELIKLELEFEECGAPTTKQRLQIIKDKINNAGTPHKIRWEFLMFLMDFWMPNNNAFEWLQRLENLTEGYLNDARN